MIRQFAVGRWILLITALLSAPCLDASAQFAVVRGQVQDADTETPLAGANVRLQSDSGSRGTAAGDEGLFTLTNISPGTYILHVTHVGYTPHSDTLEIDFGQQHFMRIDLEPVREELEEVVVESDDTPAVTTGPSHIQVSAADLQRVPMPDVSSDLMGYLVTRPGVITTGDRGGQLFIRGGTPAQNLVLVDGMRIFQPFHIVGFYSVFPADIVAHADVFAGGFSARYGGRIGSVIDVAARNGSKRRVAGSASLAPFLASVRFEAPLAQNKVSVLASARESVIERIAPNLLGIDLPYRFGDRFVKMHAFLNKTSSLSATLLHSFDEGDVAALEEDERISTWQSTALGGRYIYLPPDYPILTELSVYHTRYESRFTPTRGEKRRSDIDALHAEIRFAYLLGPFQLHFGITGATNRLAYELGSPHIPEKQNVTEGGLYIAAEYRGDGGLHVEPGLRLQSYSAGEGSTIEPRIRASWRPGGRAGKHTFSGAWGIYHQQLLGLNNQRDVTDAFTAWAAVPNHEPLPRSEHFILGWRSQVLTSLQLNVEAYIRDIDHISFPLFQDGFGGQARLERVNGVARGLDFSAELQRSWLYAYAGYSLSSVQYRQVREVVSADDAKTPALDVEAFSPPHDRRHQLNLMAQISTGLFRLSARWQFGSGVPFTPINGYFRASRPEDPNDRSFLREPGAVKMSFGDPYSVRLPSYHRLDISAERDYDFDGGRVVVHGGLINAYDRRNIFSYDLQLDRRVDQLPLIPSLGVRVELDR